MIIGFAYGAFDPLAIDHKRFLNRAKAQCNYLILGVATDETLARKLGPNRPYQRFPARLRAVWPYVDCVVACDDPDPWLRDLEPHILFTSSRQESVGFGRDFPGEVRVLVDNLQLAKLRKSSVNRPLEHSIHETT